MAKTRLLLELRGDDCIYFTAHGLNEPIGSIEIDQQRSPNSNIHLTIKFNSVIDVVRKSAKYKKRRH